MGNQPEVLRCNTANSSLTIDGKKKIRINELAPCKIESSSLFNPALHLHKPLAVSFERTKNI